MLRQRLIELWTEILTIARPAVPNAFEVPCSTLFLCAGTIGSTELLVRARERGDQDGKHLFSMIRTLRDVGEPSGPTNLEAIRATWQTAASKLDLDRRCSIS